MAGVVEAGIYPLVERYANEETTAGRHLGPEQGHSGSTAKDLEAHEKGGSILASRIGFWQKRIGNKANIFELFQKLSADALILLIELILRKIRAKANLEANLVSTTNESSSPRSLKFANSNVLLASNNNLNLYNNTYGFRPNISGTTLIGDPQHARYQAQYTIYGDLEEARQSIRKYYFENVGNWYTIDGIPFPISSEGTTTLILIRDGLIEGGYKITEIFKPKSEDPDSKSEDR